MSVSSDKEGSPTQTSAKNLIVAHYQTVENSNSINKLCIPYEGSKLTGVIKLNKSITARINKLEEVHYADL